MSESAKNESSWAKNGGVGKEMSVLRPIVWKLEKIYPYYPCWNHFGTPPGPNLGGNGFSEVSESAKNESSWAKNGGVGKEMRVLRPILRKLGKFTNLSLFGPILAPPRDKFWDQKSSEVSESDNNDFSR